MTTVKGMRVVDLLKGGDGREIFCNFPCLPVLVFRDNVVNTKLFQFPQVKM